MIEKTLIKMFKEKGIKAFLNTKNMPNDEKFVVIVKTTEIINKQDLNLFFEERVGNFLFQCFYENANYEDMETFTKECSDIIYEAFWDENVCSININGITENPDYNNYKFKSISAEITYAD